jgi:hypothetical protein
MKTNRLVLLLLVVSRALIFPESKAGGEGITLR